MVTTNKIHETSVLLQWSRIGLLSISTFSLIVEPVTSTTSDRPTPTPTVNGNRDMVFRCLSTSKQFLDYFGPVWNLRFFCSLLAPSNLLVFIGDKWWDNQPGPFRVAIIGSPKLLECRSNFVGWTCCCCCWLGLHVREKRNQPAI